MKVGERVEHDGAEEDGVVEYGVEKGGEEEDGAERNLVQNTIRLPDNQLDLGIPYDYGSIMHYEGRIGYLETKDLLKQYTIGNRAQPLITDLMHINKRHRCDDRCTGMRNPCKNGGFQNVKNCKVCVCPFGLAGEHCTERSKGTESACGSTETASYDWKSLSGALSAGKLTSYNDYDRRSCHWLIKAEKERKLEIKFKRVGPCGRNRYSCEEGGVELKADNFAFGGYKFCCQRQIEHYLNKVFKTEGNVALINLDVQTGSQFFEEANSSQVATVDKALKAWDPDGELTLKIDRCVAQMISTAILPISFVESVGFRNLIANLQPRYRLKSRTHFSRTAIPNLYSEYVEKVKAELREAHSLSITADGWSSAENTHSFLSHTGHFLDTGTVAPRFLIVGAIPLKGRHTAENMSGLLSDCLNKFSISKEKLFCMMRDGASAMVATASVLGVDSGHCFAHIIHLAVKEAIATYPAANGLITSMKMIVRKVRKSDKSNDAFKQCLADCELPDRCLLPCINVRWTLLHDMLKRYKDNEQAMGLFLLDHPKYGLDDMNEAFRKLNDHDFEDGVYKFSSDPVGELKHYVLIIDVVSKGEHNYFTALNSYGSSC
ncbi:hypothetical protein QR680_010622 [Steinernema hermaphroditum]|uniref:Metalloendopeptidase n=1 Tax=Steinernema hermaphroditum TaxID=289476 RepID=A0AA39IR50_9BILA|nr:hypothetical protein QR680_010622 [Steinernema hermaphroditum]